MSPEEMSRLCGIRSSPPGDTSTLTFATATTSNVSLPDVDPICTGCKLRPEQISEYVLVAAEYGLTPTDFVLQEEGTLNPANGHFLCTTCYVKAGCPSSPSGWHAP